MDHILRRNCLLKQVIEGKIKGEMEVTRWGRRRKKLLEDLTDRRGYYHLKEEALDRTMWRNRFVGGFGPVVRQNTEWMNVNETWIFSTDFRKSHIRFHENPSSGSRAASCGRTDGQRYMTTLTVAFHNFAQASKNSTFKTQRVLIYSVSISKQHARISKKTTLIELFS